MESQGEGQQEQGFGGRPFKQATLGSVRPVVASRNLHRQNLSGPPQSQFYIHGPASVIF